MVAAVLTEAGRDPTCVIGGRLQQGRENARLGAGDFVVVGCVFFAFASGDCRGNQH